MTRASRQGYYDCRLYIENEISSKENQDNEITRAEREGTREVLLQDHSLASQIFLETIMILQMLG